MESKIKALLLQMTAEEKLDFCAGDDTWHTHALPRLGIPALTMHDDRTGCAYAQSMRTGGPNNCPPPVSPPRPRWQTVGIPN